MTTLNGRKALSALIVFLALATAQVSAQTSGLIFKPAIGSGKTVLDPDGNGYASKTTSGFGTDDVGNSEIAYKPIPQVGVEPVSDLATGPNKGFTDFVDYGNENMVEMYLDANSNLLFRFRLANTANNSKGYSILVDADQKFGSSGPDADPDYVTGNPGFEFEIVLETNFRVALYDVNGTTTPTLKNSIAYDSACQKVIAYNAYTSSVGKYFYDFYIPFSYITRIWPSYTTSTPLRMVANTVIAPKSAMQGPISDIGGIDDAAYGNNAEAIFTKLVNNFYPTAVTGINSGFPADRSTTPALGTTILNSATSCSVTTTAGGTITVYKSTNGGTSYTPVCSTAVASAGTFTVSGCTSFATGNMVYATLTESGKTESPKSNIVTVASCTGITAIPTALTTVQNEKTMQGSGPVGATITLYNNGTYYPTTTITVGSTGTWTYNFCTGNGNHCIPCGTWWATATMPGRCESGVSTPIVISSSNAQGAVCKTAYSTSPTPSFTTSPIYTNTTGISGTLSSAVANTTVYIYKNGILAGTTTTSTTSFSFSGLTFSLGDTVTLEARSAGNYNYTAGTTTQYVGPRPPVVNSPLTAGSNKTVSGTSTEAAGTTIYIYTSASSTTPVCTTSVTSTGTWACTGITLTGGQTVTAKAYSNGQASALSNSVTVGYATTSITTSISTATNYYSGGTTVTGSISSAAPTGGMTITLYEDGYAIATTTIAAGATTWSISTLSTKSYDAATNTYYTNYLYTGGTLTATATPITASSGSEGTSSNSVTVQCQSPSTLTSTSVSPVSYNVCQNSTGSIQVTGTEANIVYTPRNSTNTADIGPSVFSSGGTITMSTYAMTSVGSNTIYVSALKIGAISCSSTLTDTANITVNAPVTANARNAGTGGKSCTGTVTLSAVSPSTGTGVWTVDSGSATFTNAMSYNTSVTFGSARNVLRWTVINGACTAYDTVVWIKDCNAVYTVNNSKPAASYANNETVATVTDPDGSITRAALVSGTLPTGMSLNTTSGAIYVSDASAITSGSYDFYVKTTDINGNTTTNPVTIVVSAPIPITLISFKATLNEGVVNLDWATASEINNNFFTIERCADAHNFKALQTQPGAGNSNVVLYYKTTDARPLKGVSYYRLKQTDFNGDYSYSPIAIIHNNGAAMDASIQVYPNPGAAETMRVSFSGMESGIYTLRITDQYGRTGVVNQLNLQGDMSINLNQLSPVKLVPGMYTISVSNSSDTYQQRFIVH